jgi:hypothetical protein
MNAGMMWTLRGPLEPLRRRIEAIEERMREVHQVPADGTEMDKDADLWDLLKSLRYNSENYGPGWKRAWVARCYAEDMMRETWVDDIETDAAQAAAEMRKLARAWVVLFRVLCKREIRAMANRERGVA